MPDFKRKAHLEPIAYLGGIAVFLGWIAGVIISIHFTSHTELVSSHAPSLLHSPYTNLIIGAFIIMIVGVIDDIKGISPRIKIGGQLIAAALLANIKTGTDAHTLGTRLAGGTIELFASYFNFDPHIIPGFANPVVYYDPVYWLGAIIIALLVLGGCNAANLIDGLDGLCTGVSAITAASFIFMATYLATGLYTVDTGAYSLLNDPVRLTIAIAFLGAALGFLPYNFNPAIIFLGDAGSMFMGYLCMAMVLFFAEKGSPALVMAALMVFALPIIDTTLAIIRRKARKQSISAPDNQHIHHQLIRAGLSTRQAVFALYIMSLGFATLGCSMIFVPRQRIVIAIFAVICSYVLVIAFKIGHRQHLLQLKQKHHHNSTNQTNEAQNISNS